MEEKVLNIVKEANATHTIRMKKANSKHTN